MVWARVTLPSTGNQPCCPWLAAASHLPPNQHIFKHLKPWWLQELSAKKKSNEQTCRDFNCTRVFIRPSSSIPWALILAYDQHLCWKHCSYLFPQGHRNGAAAAAALEDSFFELISVRSICKTTCGCVCWHRNVICFKGN